RRLLHAVLLSTAAGTPLNVGTTAYDPYRRILATKTGRLVYNAFPVRYYEPGTKMVLRPGAGPQVKVPHIATPPVPAPKPKREPGASSAFPARLPIDSTRSSIGSPGRHVPAAPPPAK